LATFAVLSLLALPSSDFLALFFFVHINLGQIQSKNYGEVYETYVISHRVWFQKNKIIIGSFPDNKRVEEHMCIARIPEYFIDERGAIAEQNFLDEDTKLHNFVPLPAAEELVSTFFVQRHESCQRFVRIACGEAKK
jgi:hypothetical protein